jgi:hypothetical protein
LQNGHYILLIAGVDCAQGTLAAARFCLDPKNLTALSDVDLVQIIVTSTARGYDVTDIEMMRKRFARAKA